MLWHLALVLALAAAVATAVAPGALYINWGIVFRDLAGGKWDGSAVDALVAFMPTPEMTWWNYKDAAQLDDLDRYLYVRRMSRAEWSYKCRAPPRNWYRRCVPCRACARATSWGRRE